MAIVNKQMKTLNVPSGSNTIRYEIVDHSGRQLIDGLRDIVVKAYVANQTYETGEYINHNLSFWRSKVNDNIGHTPGGSGSESYWEQVQDIANDIVGRMDETLTPQVEQLEEDVEPIVDAFSGTIQPVLTWKKGYSFDLSTGDETSNQKAILTDGFITVSEDTYIELEVDYDDSTWDNNSYYQIVTYDSNGTYLGYEQKKINISPTQVRVMRSDRKYKFGFTFQNVTTHDLDYGIEKCKFHYKQEDPENMGLMDRVEALEADTQRVDQLEIDVNGGGQEIQLFWEKGTIKTNGQEQNSDIYGRSVGYYAGDGDGVIISVPVGGRIGIFKYASESDASFEAVLGPSNTDGVIYSSSPWTLQTETGKYYRFNIKLNDSYEWQDPEEFFVGFSFVLSSTHTTGLMERVTDLEQQSGSDKIFTGKKCVTLGDSITYRNVFQPVVNEALGMTMVNKGIGSTTLAGGNTDNGAMSSNNRLNGVLAENADYLTILGGANDLDSYQIGDESEFAKTLENKNRQTFMGAYSYMIEYLLGQQPTLSIMILGTTWAHDDGRRYSETQTYTMFSDASRKVAQYYGLPFVDLHGECGFNAFTMGSAAANQIYSSDQIHPNAEGGKRMASLIIAKMIEAWKYTV